MAQLSITTHDGGKFIIQQDSRSDESLKLPPDGFVTFRGENQELTLHVKSIATILRTKGTP